MARRVLNGISSLVEIDDGELNEQFLERIDEAVADCTARPTCNRARTVAVVVELTPHADASGALLRIVVGAKVKTALPLLQSRTVSCTPDRDGRLVFNGESPDEPDQLTLDDDGKEQA